MATSSQKTFEMKVHDHLFTNVSLLMQAYPPSKEFLQVFRKGMFIKNNSPGFQHVVYYLLNVLDYEKLKERVPSWPIYDSKSETQFRREVVCYLNELNSIYEDACLPSIVMSHVIAPGGFKFTKYMMQLSQLVLRQHLMTREPVGNEILSNIRVSKNSEITEKTISNLNQLTKSVIENFHKLREDFDQKVKEYKKEGEIISNELKSNILIVPVLKQKLTYHSIAMKRYENIYNKQYVDDEILKMIEKLKPIQTVGDKFDNIADLINPLLKEELFFNYKHEMYPSKIVGSSQELNILDLFEIVNHSLENNTVDFGAISEKDLAVNTPKIEYINTYLEKYGCDLQKSFENLSKLASQLKIQDDCNANKVNTRKSQLAEVQIPHISITEEPLAEPLASSDESTLGILNIGDSNADL